MTKKQKKLLTQILAAAVLTVMLHFLPVTGAVRFALYLIPYGIVGHVLLRKAWKGIRNGQVFDENFLMAVATLGALLLGALGDGDYTEAVAVMLFFQVGELFESYAVGKSRRNISQLMDIRPDHANLMVDGEAVRVDPEEVPVGSIIRVCPGEKIPLDGVVLHGSSALDTAALTGESLPRDVGPGDSVISGTVSMSGVLEIRTTREFEGSTVSKILELVENATSRKSRSEAFISRFARIYTPAVCACALALAVVPPVIGLLLTEVGAWTTWLYRALSFLVASCPCALVISIPLTFFAGIGGAGREGILVKGSNYLEALARTGCVVMDKTGTLTKGEFAVTQVDARNISGEKLLEYAAAAECASSHPISKCLLRAHGTPVEPGRVQNIRELSGCGVTAEVDGICVAVGNRVLMEHLGLPVPVDTAAGTVVHVAVDGVYSGCILVEDTLKENAVQAIEALEKAGIHQTVMLTGDSEAAAQKAAAGLGITQVFSRLLPADKVKKVEQLLAGRKSGSKLVFVGDGINDAPVLGRADIGIAMGALGSDAAIEAADVVIMDDDPMKIAKSIRIARYCMAIVYQNIVCAIGIKVLSLVLVALGAANMWLAIFADVGVMVLAVLNAIRAMFVKKV